MPIQAIIFDVDGVLFNSTDSEGKYMWGRTARTDLGLSGAHFKQIYDAQWADVTRGKLSTEAHLAEVFARSDFRSLALTSQAYLDYWFARDCFVNEEMLGLLKNLTIPCYIGTNQDSHRSAHINKLIGMHFSGFFSSARMGHIKPETGFYAHIERRLSCAADELLLIDDTEVNYSAARDRGWQAFYYTGDMESLKAYLCRLGVFV